MKEAARDLEKKTNYVLRGEVETVTSADEFVHVFFVVAPKLNDYRYEVVRVSHTLQLYPATIHPRESMSTLVGQACASPEELREGLRQAFATKDVQEPVRSLLSQSRAA